MHQERQYPISVVTVAWNVFVTLRYVELSYVMLSYVMLRYVVSVVVNTVQGKQQTCDWVKSGVVLREC